ncbi:MULTISPECIES: pyridoxal 5'-phosphate synthase glutaminase subunit PdxT [Acidiplasma]|uniref:Pyridoxal 5'-phosphate synthase subunit PdxT n=2 Tax=Acidiplasma TaxID=507753 RepID=A0A0Q0RHG8_9ARCH|nr:MULTISPECIES: pyridoxal 5'-phosphate synthase glutaminase subunit PdxT [Acidiplasma]KJE48704.1 glutamine amidotransferase [Acidiplasma sp. MBA-1]KPV46849.1 glutamine amidotransferase [Acidiplasma aeolicum]KQB34734.1 glutamine amidotransferase [Acidiplasma aeolicum]WMT55479.1 MAG: pyridoxal 5'-phosphate synthase glutaminase subunit PdxT [Acidiplasma sp.]
MNIGILNIQGDVQEHFDMIKSLKRKYNVSPVKVNSVNDLENIDGLIIPGGESTVIYKFLIKNNLYDKIKSMALNNDLAVMGTCAGAIILSKDTGDDRVTGMGLLDITIKRNAYGRQVDSFIKEVQINGMGAFNAVFIRAPEIEVPGNVNILSELNNRAVFVTDKNLDIMALTFHPELTGDPRIHEYFISKIKK